MPYISQEDREELDRGFNFLKLVDFSLPITGGCINYLITKLCMAYVKRRGVSYSTYNDIIGILESVKQEFYRRVVAPYEDNKKLENGDVYW